MVLQPCASIYHFCLEPFPSGPPNSSGCVQYNSLQLHGSVNIATEPFGSPCGYMRSRSGPTVAHGWNWSKPRCSVPLRGLACQLPHGHCNYEWITGSTIALSLFVHLSARSSCIWKHSSITKKSRTPNRTLKDTEAGTGCTYWFLVVQEQPGSRKPFRTKDTLGSWEASHGSPVRRKWRGVA